MMVKAKDVLATGLEEMLPRSFFVKFDFGCEKEKRNQTRPINDP